MNYQWKQRHTNQNTTWTPRQRNEVFGQLNGVRKQNTVQIPRPALRGHKPTLELQRVVLFPNYHTNHQQVINIPQQALPRTSQSVETQHVVLFPKHRMKQQPSIGILNPEPLPTKHSPYWLLGSRSSFLLDDDTSRNVFPKDNIVDRTNELNSSMAIPKTIVHVLNQMNGFGDFLRGSLCLATIAKHYNVRLQLDLSSHLISTCILHETLAIPDQVKFKSIHIGDNCDTDRTLLESIDRFVQNSQEHNIYVYTNSFYNEDFVTQDIKNYINNFLTFKPHYYDIAKSLFDFPFYNVVHVRCLDTAFHTGFPEDNYLIMRIIELNLPQKNTLVMSNNYALKLRLKDVFGFQFLDMDAYHSAFASNADAMMSTVVEYILLSKSSRNYCFSYYNHGSGFSEQCSRLNNVPYTVTFLPKPNHGAIKADVWNQFFEAKMRRAIEEAALKPCEVGEPDHSTTDITET